MSKFTTEVRFICESSAGLTDSAGFDNIENILTLSAPHIFNFNFPIFDENYRLPLERKILRHFYTREISEETVGLWKLRLCDRLNNIMPYYNKLYNSELLEFNPFHDVDLTRSLNRENRGNENTNTTATNEKHNSLTSNGTQTNSATGSKTDTTTAQTSGSQSESDTKWDLYSDTPQGGVTGITDNNLNYLSNARKITDTKSGTNSGNTTASVEEYTSANDNITKTDTATGSETENYTNAKTNAIINTEEYVEHLTGKQSGESYSKLLEGFRRTFINIDMMILEELEDLFFGLWA